MEFNIPPVVGEYGYYDIKNLLKDDLIQGWIIYSTSKTVEMVHCSSSNFINNIEYLNRGIITQIIKPISYKENSYLNS